MKDIRKELRELGAELATSLGYMVIAVGVAVMIVFIMHEIYCKPPEESSERSSHGGSRGPGIALQLSTNPTYKWHPSNVYHH